MTPVYVQLVTWNGKKYIPYLFESLRQQKFHDWKLLILDNNSTDGTREAIEHELKNFLIPHEFFAKKENTGFAGGHNELFRRSVVEARYTMLLNQDMMLDPLYIEKLFYFIEGHSDAGSVSGRLMRWDFPHKTSTVDTIGLLAFPNHRVIDLGGGTEWSDEQDDIGAVEVFGVSGALPMYRSEALQEVAYNTEVFDEDFFAYKEDVDLAWRLRSAGWHAFTVLDAVAHHDRSSSGPKELSDSAAARNRTARSAAANKYSYRNHILLLIKNYHKAEGARSLAEVLWYEFKKSGYLFLFDTKLFVKSWLDVVRLLPRMHKKRKHITKHIRVSADELARWFTGKSSV